MGMEKPPSPEILEEEVGELLLSGELAGEGGRAVVIKISPDHVSQELRAAFSSLSAENDAENKAVKLFKLYLPNKSKNEYEIHTKVQDLIEDLPDEVRDEYARVPKLSTARDVSFTSDMRHKLEEHFSIPPLGERSTLIAMEYIDGEDLATIFYKWILEQNDPSSGNRALTAQQTDAMGFEQLYLKVSQKLDLEGLASGEIDAPQHVIDQADWKVSQRNTDKIYAYLRKNNFPMPSNVGNRVEKTLKLMHGEHMTHGDAYEKNIMITGGSKVLREKGTLEGEDTVLIDFGESRSYFVDQVDDFNVIRRLKTLSLSREEEMKRAKDEEFAKIDEKGNLLRGSKKWMGLYEATKSASETDQEKALTMAWNSTIPFKEDGIEDFFIIAKALAEEGIMDRAAIQAFANSKQSELKTPYRKNLLKRCLEWLNNS
jgi:serine/threonine protein kinase